MHLDITPEVLVAQLDLGHGKNTLNQTKIAMDNTKEFEKFSKHIISLNDKLKHMNAYIGLSNTHDYFKIKCDDRDSKQIIKEFEEEIIHWSNKYDVELRKVDDKDVYYIIGRN